MFMTKSRPAPPTTGHLPRFQDDDTGRAIDRRLLLARLTAEFGPMVVFVAVYAVADFAWATAAFMMAAVASLASSAIRTRRVPLVPLVSALIVLALGGLTLAYSEAVYVQLRPTVANSIFAVCLIAGWMFDRNLLKESLSDTLSLSDSGWRTLLVRTILFVVLLAVSNEIARRVLSVEMWVVFKAGFVIPADLLFVFTQWRFARADQARQRS